MKISHTYRKSHIINIIYTQKIVNNRMILITYSMAQKICSRAYTRTTQDIKYTSAKHRHMQSIGANYMQPYKLHVHLTQAMYNHPIHIMNVQLKQIMQNHLMIMYKYKMTNLLILFYKVCLHVHIKCVIVCSCLDKTYSARFISFAVV